MKNKITFNISASSYSMYKNSPLEFYYTYIIKSDYDTETNKSYGLAGTIVHSFLERYIKGIINDNFEDLFNEEWEKNGLNNLYGFNGNILDNQKYIDAIKYGMKLIKKIYKYGGIQEEYIEMPFYYDNNVEIKIKGYIDFLANTENGKHIIVDWKTNSSLSDFAIHAKMYHLLYLKKYKKMPLSACYEYICTGKKKVYRFTLEEIQAFEQELVSFCKTISAAGKDISKYDLGNIESPFNQHAKKCFIEMDKRASNTPINCTLKYNVLHFDSSLPEKLKKAILLKYSYFKDGVTFSMGYKNGNWDGRKYFYNMNKNTLPYGFINNLDELIHDFNEAFSTNYVLNIIDERDKRVTEMVYNTPFKDNNIKLRYYQEEAVIKALDKKVGILALGCSAGKTIIAADIIKKLNRRTLFLVNRIELAEQTKEELENYLGIEIGLMTEGELSIDKQITIASVQTIHAIINRKDETTNMLKKYLYNVSLCVADEVQCVKDSGMYRSVYSNLHNVVYIIGLSGTPFRTQNDTLEMNALEGFPIYTKLTDELTKEGFLCPSKCLFLKICNVHDKDNYNEAYMDAIVNNELRNNVIREVVEVYGENKKILILTRRLKHTEILHELIPNSLVITGSTNKSKRKKDYETFKNNNGFILIGTSKIFSAGINIPSLDIIINASAHKSSIDSIQIVGRVKRKHEGKKVGYYIDFKDNGKFLDKAAKERMHILGLYGEEVSIVTDLKGEIL